MPQAATRRQKLHSRTCARSSSQITKNPNVEQHGSEAVYTQTHQIPQRHLPLADATEAGAENLITGHKHGSDRPASLMRLLLLLPSRRSQHPTVLGEEGWRMIKEEKEEVQDVEVEKKEEVEEREEVE